MPCLYRACLRAASHISPRPPMFGIALYSPVQFSMFFALQYLEHYCYTYTSSSAWEVLPKTENGKTTLYWRPPLGFNSRFREVEHYIARCYANDTPKVHSG